MHSARNAHILWATIADRIVTSPLPPYHLAPGVPVSAMIEIGIVVLISATTTFMTVRQSVKRGIGQPGQDPNNPMANSQKYMMYIAPLFALSGLYWQFGLVLYWVTTNLWTLGQQYVLFRNMAPLTVGADADSATAPAAKGTHRPGRYHRVQGGDDQEPVVPGYGGQTRNRGQGDPGKSSTASTGSAKAAAAATTAKPGTKVSNGQEGVRQRPSQERPIQQRPIQQRPAQRRHRAASGQRGARPSARPPRPGRRRPRAPPASPLRRPTAASAAVSAGWCGAASLNLSRSRRFQPLSSSGSSRSGNRAVSARASGDVVDK